MVEPKKEPIKVKVLYSEYRAMKRLKERQRKAKRLVLELWQIFSNVEQPKGRK